MASEAGSQDGFLDVVFEDGDGPFPETDSAVGSRSNLTLTDGHHLFERTRRWYNVPADDLPFRIAITDLLFSVYLRSRRCRLLFRCSRMSLRTLTGPKPDNTQSEKRGSFRLASTWISHSPRYGVDRISCKGNDQLLTLQTCSASRPL